MSQALYLVCHATKQEVHISEVGGFGVRGADDDLVVAAFCEAHAFEYQLVALGEERADERQMEYTLWDAKNVEQQFLLIADPHGWEVFRQAFKERKEEAELNLVSSEDAT